MKSLRIAGVVVASKFWSQQNGSLCQANGSTNSASSACLSTEENKLLQKSQAVLKEIYPIRVERKLKDRWDQGTKLVDKSIFDEMSPVLKAQLHEYVRTDASKTGRVDRAVGALIGLAVGDWVGAPLEFLDAVNEPNPKNRWSHDEFCYHYVSTPEHQAKNRDKKGPIKRGQYTDDTTMALCLADSLIMCNGLNGSDLRVRFWLWHAEGLNNTFRFDKHRPFRTSFGLGYNIAKGLMSMEPDALVTPTFVNPGSNDSGNGSLMRLAPVPIMFSAEDKLTECLDAADLSSRSTHPGDCAAENARAMAFIIHRAINLPEEKRCMGVRVFLETACDEYANLLSIRIANGKPEEPVEVLKDLRVLLLSIAPSNSTEACWNWRGSQLFVEETLVARGKTYNGHPVSANYFGSYCLDGFAAALFAVAQTDSFHRAVERATNFLGDSDTVAAIAGQIAGAFYGFAAIPHSYIEPIREWDHDDILCRAVILFLMGNCSSA